MVNILHIRKKDQPEIIINNVDQVNDSGNKIAVYREGRKVGEFLKGDDVEWWIDEEPDSKR